MPEPVEFQRDESSQSRVFYAPTWEGVTRATRYGSVVSHGIGLVKRLHELGHQIVYRPHPLTGSREESFKQADAEIRNFLLHANADEGSQHFIDVSDFGWQLRQLDLMITDVSAVAYDWLATGKPLIVTRPADAAAVLLPAPIFDSLPLLDAQEIDRLDEIILSLTDSGGSSKNALRDLADRYFSAEADSDVLLERAVAQALSLQTQNESSSLDTYRARRSRLGWLRYPNFIIRILAKLVGLWTTASKKEATTPRAEIRNLFVHNSDPFDFESVGAISEELLKTAREDGRVTFVTNQVTTKLWISLRFFWENFRAWRSRAKLFVFASVSVYDAEAVVRQTKPQRILYLKDHPTNLALLRLNGPQHVLYRPESDPAFKPTHSMVMYDVIATNSRVTHEVIRGIVEVSRPGLAKLPK
jgi:hypothetical protein